MPKMEAQKCMEDFIKYKEKLDDVERDGIDCDESYEKLFMKLRDISYSYKTDGKYTSIEGEKRCNTCKNRYKDIVPYDHTRVQLKDVGSGTDYINANFIKGVSGKVAYIAAQGPLPETVVDFWKMLWENNIKVVLMACNEYEGIPRKLRCQRYWANDTSECLEIGDISVMLLKEEETNYPHEYTLRHLRATFGSETRELTHLHYKAWPDRGVPKCIPSILAMIERMRKVQPADLADAPPIVVHCSAGCGRTGTILVLDYVLNLLKFGKLRKNFSLYEIITEMRTQRMAIVQSQEQYVFVHEAVVEMFRHELQQMASNANNNAVKSADALSPVAPVAAATEYELIDLRDPIVPFIPQKLPPVPPMKQRTSNSSQESSSRKPSASSADNSQESRLLPPRKPSTDKPKSLGLLSPSTERPDVSPSDSISSVFEPFGSGANKKLPSPPSLQVQPSFSSAPSSGLYADINDPSSDALNKNGGGAYAYADPNALGKWSLQEIARNKPNDSSSYATVSDGAYSEIQCNGNSSSLEFVPGMFASDWHLSRSATMSSRGRQMSAITLQNAPCLPSSPKTIDDLGVLMRQKIFLRNLSEDNSQVGPPLLRQGSLRKCRDESVHKYLNCPEPNALKKQESGSKAGQAKLTDSEEENEYEYISPFYDAGKRHTDISDSESDDESAPPVPAKNIPATSETNPPPFPAPSAPPRSKLDQFITKLKPSTFDTVAPAGTYPAKVIYHNKDISFPNRADRPRYGKRPLKMLTIPPVI